MDNKRPIRILHVSYGMDLGGAETLIMNIYRNIDREKVQFDFLLSSNDKTAYEDEIISLGGIIHHIPKYLGYNKASYDKELKAFLIEHPEYLIIHDHLNYSASETFRIAGKLNRICIAHSHTAPDSFSFSDALKFFFRKDLYFRSDYRFACSNEAGEWLYRNKADYRLLKNGIDSEKYSFNEEIRIHKRQELGITEDQFVVGTVGRLVAIKNHARLLEIFMSILDKRKNSILVIAGDGPLRFDLEEKARKLSISDHVIFLGPRRDIPELLMAFDSFVLPSQYEGLGIALVEAMASGLPCIFTDSIPSEVNLIPSLIHRISLNDDNNVWAETIIEATPLEERKNGSLIVKDRGYDIKETAKELQDFYLKISSS